MDVAIFGNGDFKNFDFANDFVNLNHAFVIGVDGGCNYLIKNNIKIDFVIGDFDSIEDRKLIERFINVEKTNMDYSDLELAVDYCIDKKFENVYMFGCTGRRSDHFLFNLRLLYKFFQSNVNAMIIDEFNVIKVIDGNESFYKGKFKFFSIVPIYDCTEISIDGAKYNLKNKILDMVSTLTLSNEWDKEKIFISVNKPVFIYLVF